MRHANHDDRAKKKVRRQARRLRLPQNTAGSDRRWLEGKDVRFADEIRYVQRRAAERTSRIITIGPLLLFSTESGDAWMLDPVEHLATRLAEAGDPRLASVEETEKTFAVGWQGHYEIRGLAFVFNDNDSGHVTTILGYPTRRIVERIAEAFGC